MNIWKQPELVGLLEEYSNKKLYEMSMPLAVAKSHISRVSATTVEHLLKCILFKNTTDNLNHWLIEISSNLSLVGNITLKPASKKLSRKQYNELLFECVFDDNENIANELKYYQQQWKTKYPSYVVDEVTEQVYSVGKVIRDNVLDMLTAKTNYTDAAYRAVITKLLENNDE